MESEFVEAGNISLTEVKAKLKEKNKLKRKSPLFYLTEEGVKCSVSISKGVCCSFQRPKCSLFVSDIQQLLLVSVFGREASFNTRWCRLLRNHELSCILFLIIDGVPANYFLENLNLFSETNKIFTHIVEISPLLSYGRTFYEELVHVPLSLSAIHVLKKKIGGIDQAIHSGQLVKRPASFPSFRNPKVPKHDHKLHKEDSFPRTHLLLSSVQMLMEGYPFPCDIYPNEKCKGYVFTKTLYSQVTDFSPLFAVDCEMHHASGTSEAIYEVIRISVVDENLKVVYDSLVKPKNMQINYALRFTDLTDHMLNIVKRLKDVQKDLQSLLPSDSILCGQTLKSDLHALRMIHPYVIDTSIIYNISGKRVNKTTLKELSRIYLNEHIQFRKRSHNSIEDCIATMKLVKLKLNNYPEFGDIISNNVILSSDLSRDIQNNEQNNILLYNDSEENQEKVSSNETNCHHGGVFRNLLEQLIDKKKSVCIVGQKELINKYQSVPSEVKTFIKKSNSKIVSSTIENISMHDIIFSHLTLNSKNEEKYSKIDEYISKIYESCALKTLFILACVDHMEDDEHFENSLCMVSVKNNIF